MPDPNTTAALRRIAEGMSEREVSQHALWKQQTVQDDLLRCQERLPHERCAVSRCHKHDLKPVIEKPANLDAHGRGVFLVAPVTSWVRCANCGLIGTPTLGQRRAGRPRRIIWFRRDPAMAEQEVQKTRVWVEQQLGRAGA